MTNSITFVIRTTITPAFLFLLAIFLFQGRAYSAEGQEEFFKEKLSAINDSCKTHGDVLAEVRINKWLSRGEDPKKIFGDNAFSVISKVMQQQCVSIYTVIILRELKANIPSQEAIRGGIDNQIKKHLDVIEKTI